MNLFLSRLPFFLLPYSLFYFHTHLLCLKPETRNPTPIRPCLPNQPFYVGDLQIRGLNLPFALGILLTFEQPLLQPLHDTILG